MVESKSMPIVNNNNNGVAGCNGAVKSALKPSVHEQSSVPAFCPKLDFDSDLRNALANRRKRMNSTDSLIDGAQKPDPEHPKKVTIIILFFRS